MANDGDSLSEKPLGRLHVPRFAQERIHQIAIVINRSIEIAPLPMHFHVRFIDIPGSPRLSTPLSSQLVSPRSGPNRVVLQKFLSSSKYYRELRQLRLYSRKEVHLLRVLRG
jgi:hypothetical protein